MKAVLLAAGLGTRLHPLTKSMPKCMVTVGGKSVIHHNIEWLRRWGVTDLAVNLHHYPEAVRDFLGSGSEFGVTIQYSYERRLLGTAGAVGRLASWLGNETFLVLYADNLIDCDLEALLVRHTVLEASMTIALYRREDVESSGVAEVASDGRITGFIEKPHAGETKSHWISAGLLVCSPVILPSIPSDRSSDFGRDIVPALLAGGHTLGGYKMSDPESLHWIDGPEDLKATRAAFSGKGKQVDLRSGEHLPFSEKKTVDLEQTTTGLVMGSGFEGHR